MNSSKEGEKKDWGNSQHVQYKCHSKVYTNQ